MKTCNECENALFEDFGYSNYTVEGTQFICLLKKHPDGDFDRWFGEDKRLEFAEQCDGFKEGEPVSLDCEGEVMDEYKTDPRWPLIEKRHE